MMHSFASRLRRWCFRQAAVLRLTPLGIVLAACPLALAQSPAPADESATLVLETFTVTGAKTVKSLQETYASVGFVSARDLEGSMVRDYADAFRLLPNVRTASSVDSGFIIRGINSQGIGVGSGALGTLYLDGVAQTQQSLRRGANGLWDTAAIEVFRGPHSTLSGRNSLAGAIYVRTADPTFTPETVVRAQLTDDEGYFAGVAVSRPLNDRFAFRLAASFNRADDWHISYPAWEDLPGHKKISTEKNWLVRAKVLYRDPAPDGLRAVAHYSYGYFRIPRGTARGPGANAALAAQYGVTSVFQRVEFGNGFINDFFSEAREGFVHNAGVEVTKPIGGVRGSLVFTSASTFVEGAVLKPSVNGAFMQDGDEVEKEFAQEFRLNYASEGGALEGVLGVYALHGDETFFQDSPARNVAQNRITGRSRLDGDTQIRSWAVFGEGTWEFAPRWSLVAGGRLNYEKNSNFSTTLTWPYAGDLFAYRIAAYDGVAPATSSVSESEFDETVFLPKIGLVHELSADRSIAFTFQRGYRSGGTGVNTTVAPPERYFFDPEFTDNYELAWRSLWMEGRLTVNANLFHTDWIDQQIPFREQPSLPISLIINAGESRLSGGEIDVRYAATRDLRLFGNLGYTHTEFIRFVPPSNIDFAGARFPEAPLKNAALGFDYSPVEGLFFRADAQYTDRFYTSNLNVRQGPAIVAGNHTVFNVAAGYRFGPWRLTVFARNLFDTDVTSFNGALDNDILVFGRPRQVGVTLDGRF